jgi:hypothetical protein
MFDLGLVATGVVMLAVLATSARWAPTSSLRRDEIVDRLYVPALTGLLVGRFTAVTLDDPTSLRSIRALLVIRSGVEFWAAVAAGLAVLAWSLRRGRRDVLLGLADLAPFLLWAYAAYEASCVLRDGCYGPVSAVGLIPDGLQTRQLPVGLLVALAATALAFALRQLWSPTPGEKVLLAVGGLALIRSVAAFWLPRLGPGLTRPHIESLTITAAAAVIAGAVALRRSFLRRVPTVTLDPPRARRSGKDHIW